MRARQQFLGTSIVDIIVDADEEARDVVLSHDSFHSPAHALFGRVHFLIKRTSPPRHPHPAYAAI